MARSRRQYAPILFTMVGALAAYFLASHVAYTWQQRRTAAAVRSRRAGGSRGAAASAAAGSIVPSLVDAFLASPLPPRNLNLSLEAPLFFFHQRKAAGTSMRASIVEAAAAANLTSYVPCHHNRTCDIYHISTHKAHVFAGHFVWGEQRELSRRARFDTLTGTWHNPRNSASCVTMFRDPVKRLESCYYFRFVQERNITDSKFRCLSKLKSSELRRMFTEGRSRYGRGCLNEPFRILSGLADEMDIASLSHSSIAEGSALVSALTLTLKHLATCVPLVLEEPRSMQLARHWFPQLASAFHALPQHNKGQMERCPLTNRTRAVLEELAAGERLLYDAALRRAHVMLMALPQGTQGDSRPA